MCKFKPTTTRYFALACGTALAGLLAIWCPQAQGADSACVKAVSTSFSPTGPYASPNTGYIHVGQNASLNTVSVGAASPGVNDPCNMAQLTAFVIYPDNSVQIFCNNALVAGGGAIACPGGTGCIGFSPTYLIKPSDVGNSLLFHTNEPASNPIQLGPTQPITNAVQFGLLGGNEFVDDSGAFHGFGSPQIIPPLTVLTPCVNVTKNCASNCTEYGLPIFFSGVISNCSGFQQFAPDATLTIISVTDDHAGALTIANGNFNATTSSGRTYDGTLQFNESIGYHGSYTPPNTGGGSLCGPFTDTVTVVAVDKTAFTLSGIVQDAFNTVTNSHSATCHVSIAPAITLAKDCGTAPFTAGNVKTLHIGDKYSDAFQVKNTGNVPLVSVVVHDTDSKNGPADIPVGNLDIGQTVTVTRGPFTVGQPVTAADCTISDSATVTATAVCPADSTCPGSTTATAGPATCSLTVVTSPHLTATKVCGPATNNLGVPYQVSGTVANDGDADLSNVVITDVVTDAKGNTTTVPVATVPTLAAHASFPIPAITFTPTLCGPNTDHFHVTATGVCQQPAPADSNPCTTTVNCQPKLCVTKQVACVPSGFNGDCSTIPAASYSCCATGIAGAEFCYKIVVSNCPDSSEDLANVTVTDNLLDLPGAVNGVLTIGNLPLGQSRTIYVSKVWSTPTDTPIVNTVTVAGVGTPSGVDACTTSGSICKAQATVVVKPICVNCKVTLLSTDDQDSNPNDNNLQLPSSDAGSTISGGPTNGFHLLINNCGEANLTVNVTEAFQGDVSLANCVQVDDTGTPIVPQPADFTAIPIDVNGHANIVCDLVLGPSLCPGPDTINVTVIGTAAPTPGIQCLLGVGGQPITTTNNCPGTITCVTPVTCRTTGGGTMYNCDTNEDCVLVTTSLYPLANPLGQVIDHVSHGGQLGAPLSYQDCAQILADQCIRGQWEHNRHFKGPNNPADSYAIDFHTEGTNAASHPIFDTLLCACLGCCGENTKGGPTGVPAGWLHKKFPLCNPEDHRVCGPEPRPAPANALIWSGIGKLTPANSPNGKARTATYAVLRVYVEDRSEPGGWFPKGSVSPADVYCFQAWDTGIPIAKKGDPNNLGISAALGGLDVNVFRSTVSADSCAFLQGISVGGTCPPGSLPAPIVAGVCASVSDTGTLRTGNQQIHPSTGATCKGPGFGIPAPTPLPVSGCVNPTQCTTDPTITPCQLVTPVGP